MELLGKGINVAAVFTSLPKTYKGFKVINADLDDLRFTDPKGVICGLKYKFVTGNGGGEKNIEALKNGFVIITDIEATMKKLERAYKYATKKKRKFNKKKVVKSLEVTV